jgi:4-aminobutyrate aminotransferase-like enzyme/Ser/Thr protein kinase RdoA (MazF antagonist)
MYMDEDVRQRPRFSADDAVRIARDLFGVAAQARELPSERDQNFHLVCDSADQFVLKLSNLTVSEETLDCQNQAMARVLQTAGRSVCPRIHPSLAGTAISECDGNDQRRYYVRLVTYLSGQPLSDVDPHSPAILQRLGTLIGSITHSLVGFDHVGAHRELRWDLDRAVSVIGSHITYIDEGRRRVIIQRFLHHYDAIVAPRLSELRKSVIHNDCNDHNIIVGPLDQNNERAVGVIDFGDLVYTSTVNELAIGLAYVVLDKPDPIPSAAFVVGGYHAKFPLKELELAIVFPLACMRLCVSVVLSALQRSLDPDNKYLSVSEQPAWHSLERLAEIAPQSAVETFREACGFPQSHGSAATRSKVSIQESRRKHLGESLSLSYDEPLHIVRGAMQYLYDENGRPYLDCVNNVCHVGHCHPRVVAAAQHQIAVLNTNTRYLHENIVEYAERLVATLPSPLEVCFIVNSGSEANDLAIRMAWAYTGRSDIIVVDGAYHGNLSSLIDISPYKFDGPGGRGAPSHVHKVAMPDIYRGQHRSDDAQAGRKYSAHVAKAIQGSNDGISAFICESILSCGGQIILPHGYLGHAYQHVKDAGGVCIADEVQVGFGRVGTHFWGFETQAVVPDIVTLGKPIGNGHPLAAVITTREIAHAFANGMEYFNTFGGNSVSCAVGLAVLDAINDDNLQQNADQVGSFLKAELENLKTKHALIGDVRGMGLFLGIEFVLDRSTREPAADEAARVVHRLKEHGILLSTDGPLHNVIKIKPPLPFSQSNANFLLTSLDSVLDE